MIPAWLRHLFVADEPENSRIAADERAEDRRTGRLPEHRPGRENYRYTVDSPLGFAFFTPPGYHTYGCIMRFEAQRHHLECPCECHE